jgi:UDP-glucose 4-epimerase
MSVFLVTGGAGFIGSSLVEALVARGDEVRVFDNFTTGHLANLSRVKDRIEIVTGDVGDLELLSKAANGVECIFHYVTPPGENCDDVYRVAGGWTHSTDTLSVLSAAREAGVRRVIYSSSGSIYGHADALQMKESDPILPASPDAFLKLSGEHQCIAFSSVFGLETVRLRYFSVFGPRQSAANSSAASIPVILKAMLKGQSPILLENVYEYHDFLYVDDAAHAALLAAAEMRAAGAVYNIGRGRPVNLLGVVEAVNEILGTQIEPVISPRRREDFQPWAVSIVRAEAELGFCARTDLNQGLEAMIDFYSEQFRSGRRIHG